MMKKRVKYILKGAGSIMNIAPASDYSRFISKESVSKRISNHWVRTGRYIHNSIKRYGNEQKEEK